MIMLVILGKESDWSNGIEITIHHIIPKRVGGKELVIGLCRNPCHNLADLISKSIYPEQVVIKEVV